MSAPVRATRFALLALATLAMSPFTPSVAGAQSLWMPRDGRHAISLEMLRPNIEGQDAEFFSAAFFLSGRFAATPAFSVIAEVPYARFRSETGYIVPGGYLYGTIFEDYYSPSTTLGNPYIGIEAAFPGTPIFLELGGRPPIASDGEYNAQFVGSVSDVSRLFAFTERYASVRVGFNLYEVTPSRMSYRFRLSPFVAIPSEGYSDTEIFTDYSLQLGYQGSVARFGMGVAGMLLMTQGGSNLGERNLAQLELHGDFLSGPIRPGVDVHLPLDYFAQDVPVVVGASLTWMR